jgi:D-glycero-beta-D-manno-heptose-7-phosphate kinase
MRDKQKYLELIKNLKNVSILVFGDTMLDRFIFGKVSRISPEAPVPIVEVEKEKFMPGGAGNVAQNISSLGATPYLVSVEGCDFFGELLLKQYNENVNLSGIIKNSNRESIVKTRIIGNHQQIVRLDNEKKHSFTDEQIKEIKLKILEILAKVKVVIISDYGKGMINEKTLDFLIEESNKRNLPILVDPKIEHFKKYKNITCMTPNLLEAKQGMERMNISPIDVCKIEELGKDIRVLLDAESIMITRSEHGVSLFEKDKITHIPTMAKEVFDVTGAGDTVISTLAVCLGNGINMKDSAYIANFVAGIVVGKVGTSLTTKQEILDKMKNLED